MSQPVCMLASCSRPATRRGYCNSCCSRLVRQGKLPLIRPQKLPLKERLMAKADQVEGGCWLWAGAKNSEGYGQIKLNRTTLYAHRVSYEAYISPIPEGLHLDHICRHRACINPRHLQPVTVEENVRRGVHRSALTVRLGFCQRGHEMTDANVYVRPDGSRRICRACKRLRDRTYRAARAERKRALAKSRT